MKLVVLFYKNVIQSNIKFITIIYVKRMFTLECIVTSYNKDKRWNTQNNVWTRKTGIHFRGRIKHFTWTTNERNVFFRQFIQEVKPDDDGSYSITRYVKLSRLLRSVLLKRNLCCGWCTEIEESSGDGDAL